MIAKFAAAATLLLSFSVACAQEYPAREIRSICNFAAGSGADIIVRFYSERLSRLAGKPVLVENKPGVQGTLASDFVAKSKPDGYTLMITPASSRHRALHLQEAAVRPAEGLRAGHLGRGALLRARGGCSEAHQVHRRAGEDSERQAESRLLRHRLEHRPGWAWWFPRARRGRSSIALPAGSTRSPTPRIRRPFLRAPRSTPSPGRPSRWRRTCRARRNAGAAG